MKQKRELEIDSHLQSSDFQQRHKTTGKESCVFVIVFENSAGIIKCSQ